MSSFVIVRSEELAHYGITGQKWGVRRFENPDGTLTEEGKLRYGTKSGGNSKLDRQYDKDIKRLLKMDDKTDIEYQKIMREEYASAAKSSGIAAIGVALAAIGANKLPALGRDKVTMKGFMNIDGVGDVGSWKETHYIPSRTMNDVLSFIGGVSAAAIATSAVIDTVKSQSAKRNASASGHSSAVAKRDQEYQRIKNKYSGTKYADSIDSALAGRKRERDTY